VISGEWSKLYGVEAPLTGPMFEEYSPELRGANSTMRRTNEDDCSSVVLTKQIITSDYLPCTPSVTSKVCNGNDEPPRMQERARVMANQLNTSNDLSYTPSVRSKFTTKTFNENEEPPQMHGCSRILAKQTITSVDLPYTPSFTSRSCNGNDEPPQMQGRARVLYDYQPIEGDEIALSKGL
jgi:hypothetical protein